jgi:hypothetical protein
MIAGMYEVIPVRGVIPAVPVLGPAPHHVDELRSAHTIRITGAATVFFQADAARREAEAMLASCRGEVERGHHYALIELLDANPAFMAVAWVRETCRSFIKEGHPLRRRGRIRGKYTFHPLMLVGLVRHLITMGDAKSPEQAFGLLETGRERSRTTRDCAVQCKAGRRRFDRIRAQSVHGPHRHTISRASGASWSAVC